MPALTASYQKKATITQLQKAYSVLNQAARLASIDHSEFEFKGATQEGVKEWFEEYILPYVKTVQFCSPVSDCGIDLNDYKTLDGTRPINDTSDRNDMSAGAVLPDGSILIAHSPYTDINYYYFVVDVNGKKGPDVLGKDVFRFANILNMTGDKSGYTSKGVSFAGAGLEREQLINYNNGGAGDNGCAETSTGKFCGALIQADGWEIKDDYPW